MEEQLRQEYEQAAGEMLALGHKLDELKRRYDWLVADLGGVEPSWGGGAQVLESLRATIQTTNLVALQNLLYHNSGE
jgi:hypothetical protein